LIPSGSRLLRIVWPLLAVVALLALLGTTSIDILSSVRAYVAGEGLWSKAQKESVYHLYRYAETRAESDYRRYQEAIAVPLGDRKAREELEKPGPDLEVARQGFLEGRNHPDDIPDMIWLFRRFRNVSYIDKAIGIWSEGDRNIAELMRAAEALHTEVSLGSDPATHAAILARISEINATLTPLEDAFSFTLGEASRDTEVALIAATLFGAACLALIGIAMSRRLLRQSEALESAERFSEERFHLAMVGSNDGLWEWDLRSGAMYISPRIKDLLGYADREIENTPGAFVALVHPDDRDGTLSAVRAHVRKDVPYDVEFRARTKSGGYRWLRARGRSVRDGAGRAVRVAGSVSDIKERRHVHEPRVAELDDPAVAVESIGDAVITTDLEGKVTFVNAAAEKLTGWKRADAKGKPLSVVCQLIDEALHAGAPDPIERALRRKDEYRVARGILLRCRDGTEIAIRATAVPLRGSDEEVHGALLVLRDARQERHYATQLSHQASHDALTGLINRREFERRLSLALAGARENGRHHAMLYLDLDQFKLVNDTSGHAAGDELMRQVSLVLGERLREGDTLARLGGDEFGVLLENCLPAHALRIAQGLRPDVDRPALRLARPVILHRREHRPRQHRHRRAHPRRRDERRRRRVLHGQGEGPQSRPRLPPEGHGARGASRGDGVGDAAAGRAEDESLLPVRAADRRHRARGPHRAPFRAPASHGRLARSDGPPDGVHPRRRALQPDAAIDRWVVRQAFELIANRTRRAGPIHPTSTDQPVGASLGDDDFLDFVRDRFLQFELATRRYASRSPRRRRSRTFGKAVAVHEELRALGCRFSLDDFGVGHVVVRLSEAAAVDFLKIDGASFRTCWRIRSTARWSRRSTASGT
jgi:diguanylate cyclase (GGDEF)-like protein/PAS domain S-box-containing protein